jgi:uncharacterized ferredoxin-like protein
MAEARQTLDPVLLIKVVPGPHCVAVQKQHFGDRLTAHSSVQQQQRVGAAARALGLINAEVSMGIPVSIGGKSIYFDRQAPAKH